MDAKSELNRMLILRTNRQRLVQLVMRFVKQVIEWIAMKYSVTHMEKQIFCKHHKHKMSNQFPRARKLLLLEIPWQLPIIHP